MTEALAVLLMGVVAWVAWILMTFGPISAALGSWRLATHVRHGWVAHLLFIPALLGAEWLLVDLMFWGARDDGDGPPGLGLAMVPAIGVLLVTFAAYYVSLAARGVGGLRRAVHARNATDEAA
jgi:hypothetical protein